MTERLTEYIKTLVPLSDIRKEENLKELFKNIMLGKAPPGTLLFNARKGNENTYYLLDGELVLTDDKKQQNVLRSTDPNCRFPVGYNQPHKYSVKALSEISYLKINSETLDALLTWDQVTTPLLRRPVRHPDDKEVNWMSRILELELFQRVPPSNIQAMFLRFENVEMEAGDIIIRQGDDGDFYYVIKSGRCAIYRSDDIESNPLQFKLAELGPGDSFGEEALVSDNPRNASVVMREAGELARLSKDDFLHLLKEPVMKSLSYEEAEVLIQAGAQYVDARTENEYLHNHLPNSLNLPLATARQQLQSLDKNTEYIVYCDTGSRSAAACYIMNQRGIIAHLLNNGLKSVPYDAFSHPSKN